MGSDARQRFAVIGSGISGLSAAWMLQRSHDVEVFEADNRVGGHSNTLDVTIGDRKVPVDTGFIVYNEPCYPNLTALFAHLGVETAATDMSFAVSLDRGRLEYAGSDLLGLLAQPANLVRPRFWSMVRDLLRFYREAPAALAFMGDESLDDWLDARGYGAPFREDHLYPMAAAIWSTPAMEVGQYPAADFVRFCENHGLLRLTDRPQWRTVVGGSRAYVAKLTSPFADRIHLSTPIVSVRRTGQGVDLTDAHGVTRRFDGAIIATHGDRALAMLADADGEERRILSTFRYSRNLAVLHADPTLMPGRRRAWASWNYLSDGRGHDRRLSVTYWMNRLQPLGEGVPDLFVTLNPLREPREELVHARIPYEHPIFDAATGRAQRELWSLQGRRNTWFAGAHFGAGFHEDGLQAGLAAAEDAGARSRPWKVADPDGRIVRTRPSLPQALPEAAE
jgi:predicted NAD/FAD-binding protein